MKKIVQVLLSVFLLVASIQTKVGAQTSENKLAWFQDAKFGLFIHWGVYSKIAGEWKGKDGYNEHVMLYAKIPIVEYEQVAKTLNPVDFDAEAWVFAAKNAGMKYIVITTKHHDGFAMYNSPSSPFNIVNFTTFKRDPVKELADACRKLDVKFGVYYSLGRDWHDPDVPTNWPVKAGRSNTWDFPDEDAKDFSKYFERKLKPQVTELINQYHPAILWFDTPEMINKAQSKELKDLVASLNPHCIVNERVGNKYGDYLVLEQKGGDKIIPSCWETCLTMSRNWGYIKTDTTFKSPEKLIGLLVDAVSKGGNLLLNIGPTAEGIIRPQNLDCMSAIGKWLSVNGEAIYGTRPWKVFGENADSSAYIASEGFKPEEKDAVFDGTPKDLVQDIRFTSKENELFIIARSWRDKDVIVKSLSKQNNPIKSISLLGHKVKINWKQTVLETKIEIPKQAFGEIPVYVFKVKFAEKTLRREWYSYDDSVLIRIRNGYEDRRTLAFEQLRSKPLVREAVIPPIFSDGSNFSRGYSYSLVDFAFKCFWLNEQIVAANDALMENANYYIGYPAAYKDKDSFYWAVDELCRILEYFGSRGTIRAGLVTKETEERIFLMMWQYSKMQSKVAKAEYQISKTWYVEESENHHIQRFYAAWHFAMFLKENPLYKDLKYDDGYTAAEHFAAWNDYIKQWIPERAKKGLFIEMANDGYGLETLKGVYNFYDFADDPQLRQLSGKLLDLYWAAWAQEQLSGVRGGAKSRIYPDGSSHGRTAFWKMSWYYLGMNEMNEPKGNLFTLVTSSYQMPLVVMDIALDADGRGEYEIVQRNPGLAEDGFYTPKPSYHLQENGGLIRYSYCTPNFIMGSLLCEARRYEDWVMISSQNRWMGIIYNENPDARIFPLCKTGEDKRAYNQMWAVQKKGTMIVQKLKNQLHSRGAGEMQVWISKQGLSSPVEKKGWVFVDCGKSFTAIKPVKGGYKWLNEKEGRWMVCENQYTPVIFEVAPKSAYRSMREFQEKIIANSYSLQNNVLHYNSLDGNLLTLPTDYKGLPSVNGKEVNLAPDLVWDSPFIASKFNSGIVKIQKGDRTLNLDFLENSQAQSAPLNTSGKIPQEPAVSTKEIF